MRQAVALLEPRDHRARHRRAADEHRRIAERSQLPGSASSSARMPSQIVGTPAAKVTRSCAMLEQALGVEVGPGKDELRAQQRREYGKPQAFAWNIGTTGRTVSSLAEAEPERVVRADAERVQHRRAVPVDDAFGRPVVPDV